MTDQFNHDQRSDDSSVSAETALTEAPAAEPAATGAGVADSQRSEMESAAAGDPIEALRREKDALYERLLRTAADFDNYRKRVERERRDQADAAMADALQDLLPIVDDLERALLAPAADDVEAYRKGVELIHRQMSELLRKRGVTAIDAVGADFDPRYHQAVIQEVSSEHREGEIMEELRRGYMLGDRLLRPAMVKVARS